MDGVLADFDQHHENIFGVRPDRVADNVDWNAVRSVKDFFLHIPPMKDMTELWDFIKPLKPIVLTGIPSPKHKVSGAADNKLAWIKRHLGDGVEVRCVLSKEKHMHAGPGDVLIDDWDRYRDLWLAKGGRWITHTSAASTIKRLREISP
jgi:hypothetical protein